MNAKTDTRPLVSRCPACGQRVDPPDAGRCPLCDFDFGDDRVTGVDVTPYANADAQGNSGWWTMCRWVWSAGSERLKHIALMRTSAAAKRFAWINLLWLALGLAILQGTRVGWTRVLRADPAIKPGGRGWIHLADSQRGLVSSSPADSLWWNPAQAMIASVVAGLTALLLMWLLLILIRMGVAFAHGVVYRGEQRMSAALLYGTAWWIPALAGFVISFLRPLAFVGQMSRGGWYPTNQGLSLVAGACVGLAATLWWFWLIRLGAAAPVKTRSRVMAFFTLGISLLLAGMFLAWRVGLEAFHEFLFVRLNMHF